jgi:hypothetical protein
VSALEEEILVLESKLAEGREGPRALSKINKRNTNNNYNTTNKAGEEASRAARDPTLVKHKHDPFVRRPTQLSNYWTTAATPAALEVSHADQQAPPPPQQKQRGDVAQLTAASKSCAGVRALTEAHRAVQLHIDMSLITTALAPSLSTPKGRLPPVRVRRGKPRKPIRPRRASVEAHCQKGGDKSVRPVERPWLQADCCFVCSKA